MIQKHDILLPPEKNPLKILWFCRRNIVSLKLCFAFWVIVILSLIVACSTVSFPQYFNVFEIYSFSDFAINGVSIIFVILSVRAYSDDCLTLLYQSSVPAVAKKRMPPSCSEEVKEHFIYYSYIAEYYLAAMLWVEILFGSELKAVISLGDDALSNIIRTVACVIYSCVVNLFLLVLIELIIKSFARTTNSVKLDSRPKSDK